MGKKFISIILVTFFGLNLLAQDKPIKIVFDAKITSVELVGAKINVASVKLFKNNLPIDSIVTQKGRCFFPLDTGQVYKVEFSKTGYVSKHLVVDTRGIPTDYKKKSKLKVDVALFRVKRGLNVDFLAKKPMGIATYNFVDKKMRWDTEYTRIIVEKIIESTLEYNKNKDE